MQYYRDTEAPRTSRTYHERTTNIIEHLASFFASTSPFRNNFGKLKTLHEKHKLCATKIRRNAILLFTLEHFPTKTARKTGNIRLRYDHLHGTQTEAKKSPQKNNLRI